MKAPCRGCSDRSVGCHGECERYKVYHEANQKRYKENLLKDEARDYQRNIFQKREHRDARKGKVSSVRHE